MGRIVKVVLGLAIVLVAAFFGARLWLTHSLEASILARPQHAAVKAPVSDERVDVEEARFDSTGEHLRGRWMRPHDDDQVRGAVFIAHGGQPEWIEDWSAVQRLLAEAGYDSFVFDYAGFGDSSGSASVDTLARDTRAAWAHFVSKTPTATPVFLLGLSAGCAQLLSTLDASAARARSMVLMSCFSSVRDYLEDSGRLRAPLNRITPDVFDNIALAPKVRMPVLQIHGSADDVVPVMRAQQLHAAFPQPKTLLLVEGMQHNDPFKHPAPEVWETVVEFLSTAPATQ